MKKYQKIALDAPNALEVAVPDQLLVPPAGFDKRHAV